MKTFLERERKRTEVEKVFRDFKEKNGFELSEGQKNMVKMFLKIKRGVFRVDKKGLPYI
jgi:hypothetical protein